MISGTFTVPRVQEETICRNATKYKFISVGDYKIHCTSMMPLIPFEEAVETPDMIDKSLFINDSETKLDFPSTIKTQNYITTKYIGLAPLRDYEPSEYTERGHEFTLKCRGGNPNYKFRTFGTPNMIHGYNIDESE